MWEQLREFGGPHADFGLTCAEPLCSQAAGRPAAAITYVMCRNSGEI